MKWINVVFLIATLSCFDSVADEAKSKNCTDIKCHFINSNSSKIICSDEKEYKEERITDDKLLNSFLDICNLKGSLFNGKPCQKDSECISTLCSKIAKKCISKILSGSGQLYRCSRDIECRSSLCNMRTKHCIDAPQLNGSSCQRSKECRSYYCSSRTHTCADRSKEETNQTKEEK